VDPEKPDRDYDKSKYQCGTDAATEAPSREPEKSLSKVAPIVETAGTITIEAMPAISAYSIAVTADLSTRKDCNVLIMARELRMPIKLF
jgi:hypothetical protein